MLIFKQPIHFPVHEILNTLLQSPPYCLLLPRTQPIQVGEANSANLESPQQARQPLAPGEGELALGEEENRQPGGKEGEGKVVRDVGKGWWEKGNVRENEGREKEITRKTSEIRDRVREIKKRGDTGQKRGE